MFSRASLSCIIEILCQVTTNSPFFCPHDVITQATSSWSGFSSKDKTYFNCPRSCPLPPCPGTETFSGQKRSKMSWHDCLPPCWHRVSCFKEIEKLTEKLRPLRRHPGGLNICRKTECLLIILALSYSSLSLSISVCLLLTLTLSVLFKVTSYDFMNKWCLCSSEALCVALSFWEEWGVGGKQIIYCHGSICVWISYSRLIMQRLINIFFTLDPKSIAISNILCGKKCISLTV